MSTKLKALGLSLIAMLAMGAFAAVNAGAENGGHFTSEKEHTTLFGEENETHLTHLNINGFTGIWCTRANYHGTFVSKTVEQLTITPEYGECQTTGGASHSVVIDMNGCDYLFTIGKNVESEGQTVHLLCPMEEQVVVTHEGCEIALPPQSLGGARYTTKTTQGGVHDLTVDFDITEEGTAHFEAGFCILLGTKQAFSIQGSITLKGFNTILETIDITATGSEE